MGRQELVGKIKAEGRLKKKELKVRPRLHLSAVCQVINLTTIAIL